MKLVAVFSTAVFSLGTLSCTGALTAGPVHIAPTTTPTANWDAVVAENTRRDTFYADAIRQADLRATLVTPRLRKAFLDTRAEFHGKFAEEAQQELVGLGNPDEGVDAKMKAGPDSEEQVLVFVAMYVTDQKNRDIAASYTIWDSRLVRGEASVAPIQIDTVRSSPAVAALFPYVDRFDDLYLMRFPLVDSAGHPLLSPGEPPLRLEVKSALAETTVSWTLLE